MKRLFLSLFVLVMLIAVAPIAAQDTETLTVFAAASLNDAFTEIKDAFEEANPGVEVLYNFGGSSTLATQLIEGAPADVFASANNTQMTVAVEGERIGSEPEKFVSNRLILIVPVDNPAGIESLDDLANEGIKLVLAAPGVPVRDYTEAMLEKMAEDEAYGEAYREAVLANLVSEEDNVRQVAAKVALGEADAGIVYSSDVTPDIADDVLSFPIPDEFNTLASYPIAITDDTPNPELAQAFVDYVLSEDGQATLVKWGFISVIEPEQVATVSFDGQVLNPLALTADSLSADFAPQSLDVTYVTGSGEVNTSFTGVLLWDVVNAAQPDFNPDVHNDKLSMYFVVSADDGYQVVVAWGEIDPEFGNQPILLAFEENGEPLEGNSIRLVVPGDIRGGRYVSGVVNISLLDAPPADA